MELLVGFLVVSYLFCPIFYQFALLLCFLVSQLDHPTLLGNEFFLSLFELPTLAQTPGLKRSSHPSLLSGIIGTCYHAWLQVAFSPLV